MKSKRAAKVKKHSPFPPDVAEIEAAMLKKLRSMRPEDIFPESNKRAAENLRRAGLIK